ncbi:MAG TPA: TolC family protein [Blastocatellia bacterium]|nr:TolC family protein [Blastocatellia bacterium]
MKSLRLYGVIAVALISWITCADVMAQTAVKLTLSEAEDIAVKNQPQLAAAQLTARAAEMVQTEVGSARLPLFSAGISGADASKDARIGAGGLNNPLILSRGATGVTINQLLFDFGRTNSLVKSARYNAEAFQQTAEATRARVLLQVDSAYFVALRAQAVLKVADQTIAARQAVADQVEALRASGLKSGLDVSVANYNLAEAKLLRAKSENDVKAAFADLSASLGSQEEQTFDLAEESLPTIDLPDQSELIREALSKRPDLHALQFEQDAAYQTVKAEKMLKLPSVSALWSAGWVPFGDSSRIPNTYNAAGFSVSIPIFNGRLYKAREAEAEFKARAVEQRLKDAENRVTRDVRIAWLSLNTAYERIGLSAQLLSKAREALDLAQERYNLGLSSFVELSQAQLNVTIAEIESANARYEYQLQRAILKYQTASQ